MLACPCIIYVALAIYLTCIAQGVAGASTPPYDDQYTTGSGQSSQEAQCDRMRYEWPMVRDHIMGLRDENEDMPRVKKELFEMRIRLNDLENRLAHCSCPVKGKPLFGQNKKGMNLGDVLDASCRFYSTLRSGPHNASYPGTKFPQNNVDLYDRDTFNNSLTGGWRDPDDGVKYTCAMAWSSTVITWSMLRYAHAYKISMTWEYSMSNIRWTMDYFLKMFKTGSMYGQVGGEDDDEPTLLWEGKGRQPVANSQAASDDLADVSAAMSSASMLFKKVDPEYSELLLESSKTLFRRAIVYNKTTTSRLILEKYPRGDHLSFNDEISWASLWLYRATRDQLYFNAMIKYMTPLTLEPVEDLLQFNCTSKYAGTLLMLSEDVKAKIPNILIHKDAIFSTIRNWFANTGWEDTASGIKCIPLYDSIPNTVNNGWLLLVGIDTGVFELTELYPAINMQLSHILGFNMSSMVVGVGDDSPKQSRHFDLQCPYINSYPDIFKKSCLMNFTGENAFQPTGALIKGPGCDNVTGGHKPRSDTYNTISAVNNACFQAIVAGLHMFSQVTDAISIEPFSASFYNYKGVEEISTNYQKYINLNIFD